MVCCQQEKWRQNANPGKETAFSPSEGQDGWTHKTCNRNKWINFLIVEKLHLLVLFMALFYGKNHLSINFWFAAMKQYQLNGMPPVNWTIEICQWMIAHLIWSMANGWHSVVPLKEGPQYYSMYRVSPKKVSFWTFQHIWLEHPFGPFWAILTVLGQPWPNQTFWAIWALLGHFE